MEESHHSGASLSMNEASDVEKHWRETLRTALERCFRIIRDHRALHGGLTALHAFPPSVTLPEGHKAKVRQFFLHWARPQRLATVVLPTAVLISNLRPAAHHPWSSRTILIYFAENTLWHCLFGLLFWDELFETGQLHSGFD